MGVLWNRLGSFCLSCVASEQIVQDIDWEGNTCHHVPYSSPNPTPMFGLFGVPVEKTIMPSEKKLLRLYIVDSETN